MVSYGREAGGYYTDVLSGQATEYVRSVAPDESAFFLHLTLTAPHMPATPAERHEDAFADEEAPRPHPPTRKTSPTSRPRSRTPAAFPTKKPLRSTSVTGSA